MFSLNKFVYAFVCFAFILSVQVVVADDTTSVKLLPALRYYAIDFENTQNTSYHIPRYISQEVGRFKYGRSSGEGDLVFIEGNFSESMTKDQVKNTKDAFNIGTADFFIISNIKNFTGNNEPTVSHILQYLSFDDTNIIFFDNTRQQKITVPYQKVTGTNATIQGRANMYLVGSNYTVYLEKGTTNIAVDMNADGNINRKEVRITTARGAIIDLGNAFESDNGDTISVPLVNFTITTPKGIMNGLPHKDEIVATTFEAKAQDRIRITSVSGSNFSLSTSGDVHLTNYNVLFKLIKPAYNPPYDQLEMVTFLYPSKNTQITECSSTPTNNCFVTKSVTFAKGVYNLHNGVEVHAPNIVLDCNGATLNGNNINKGIHVAETTGTTVKNCLIKDYQQSFLVESSTNNNIEEIDIRTNKGNGVEITEGSFRNNLRDSKIISYASGLENTFTGNEFFSGADRINVTNTLFDRTTNNNKDATIQFISVENITLINNTIQSGTSATALDIKDIFGFDACNIIKNTITAQKGAQAVVIGPKGYCLGFKQNVVLGDFKLSGIIAHNTLNGNGDASIEVKNNTIQANEGIIRLGGRVINNHVSGANDVVFPRYEQHIEGNSFIGNKIGMNFTHEFIGRTNITNNIFNNTVYDVLIKTESQNKHTFLDFRRNKFYGEGIVDNMFYTRYCDEPNEFAYQARRPARSYCGYKPNITIQGKPSFGNTLQITFEDKFAPNKQYIIAMALGDQPGIPLPDERKIPLNYDFIFLNSLYYPAPIGLTNTQGTLDYLGRATATWTIPSTVPLLENVTFYISGMAIDNIYSLPLSINSIADAQAVTVTRN